MNEQFRFTCENLGFNPTLAHTKEEIWKALSEVIVPDELTKWWTSPCQAFGGVKPADVWSSGEFDLVWNAALRLSVGGVF